MPCGSSEGSYDSDNDLVKWFTDIILVHEALVSGSKTLDCCAGVALLLTVSLSDLVSGFVDGKLPF